MNAPAPTELLKQPQYIIEGIILRRLHEKRIEGYTIEMAKEIDAALRQAASVSQPEVHSGEARDALVKKISAEMCCGKDSGGYETLLDMYAHIALKVVEASGVAQAPASAEDIARTICLSYGRDPDELASWLEVCDAENRPLPTWRVYEEQAEAIMAAFPTIAQASPGWIDQNHQIDRYGVALMMIREGCADPAGLARRILSEFEASPVPSAHRQCTYPKCDCGDGLQFCPEAKQNV